MTIDPILLAILSLDVYSQGYGKKLVHGETQIGTASKKSESSDNSNEGEAISFFAAEYNVGSVDGVGGQTVIAYRGTDTDFHDPWTGWGGGTGSAKNNQAVMAATFYRTVINTGSSLTEEGNAS